MTDEPMSNLFDIIRELRKYDTPDGWTIATTPGWEPDPLQLPTSGDRDFSPALRGDEIIEWGDKRFPGFFVLEASRGATPADYLHVRLFMMLSVEHEVRLSGAAAGGDDVTEVLKALFRVRPLDWWKRKAIAQLGLARDDLPDGVSIDDEVLVGPLAEFEAWMQGVIAPTTQTQQRRNNRITPTLLREVAEVYRAATADGRAPTAAVADYFTITRENAAKWVSRARKDRFLGPALGPTGGEVPPDE